MSIYTSITVKINLQREGDLYRRQRLQEKQRTFLSSEKEKYIS
jgi:hypothetical protein